jgi:TolB-like protein
LRSAFVNKRPQLASTTTSAKLGSESLDRSQGDLFASQDLVATLIGYSIAREVVIVAARY